MHVCTALIGSIHKPKNVSRPPIHFDEVAPAHHDESQRLSILSEETSKASTPSPSLHSSESDIPISDKSSLEDKEDPKFESKRKRVKSNSICVGPSNTSPLSTPRRRGASFLHLHLPEFGSTSHPGPQSAPHFHIPTLTITAPSSESAASRKLSSAFHGLGAFGLRRHSNTVSLELIPAML